MSLPPKSCKCPCGNEIKIPESNDYGSGEPGYDVCNIICPKCGRHSSGGNYKTGEVSGWMTAASVARSNAEYERQLFESDMNEWYGRGNW